MGKKKLKKPTKLSTKKEKRDIFNTGEKTLPEASKFNNKVNAAFVKYLKETNIPVFQEFTNAKNALGLYFMNRKMMEYILGDYIVIFDRIMKDTIAEEVSAQVLEKIKADMLPGHWTTSGLMAMARRLINVIVIADKPENGPYLSAHPVDLNDPTITWEMVQEYPAATCMRFSDYNPNRFYQFFAIVQETAFRMVMTEVTSNTPYANLPDPRDLPNSSGTSTRLAGLNRAIAKRYGNEFKKYATETYNEWSDKYWNEEGMTAEGKIKSYAHMLCNAINAYSYRVLQTTGVCQNAIDVMMGIYDPKVTYTLNGLNNLNNVATSAAFLTIFYKPVKTTEKRGPGAKIVVPLDLVARVMGEGSATDMINLGKRIREFTLELMNLAIISFNDYIKQNANPTPKPLAEEDRPSEAEPPAVPPADAKPKMAAPKLYKPDRPYKPE